MIMKGGALLGSLRDGRETAGLTIRFSSRVFILKAPTIAGQDC